MITTRPALYRKGTVGLLKHPTVPLVSPAPPASEESVRFRWGKVRTMSGQARDAQ